MDVELADKKDMMKQRGFHIRVKSILLSECCAETCVNAICPPDTACNLYTS